MAQKPTVRVEVHDQRRVESSIRKFKRMCESAGILKEYKKRKEYKKPSIRKKEKEEAAEKRKSKELSKQRRTSRM
ncbi:MAG: 30S ribosomal protein S21 [Bdellovibrionales bacterium]|jgi:small subunit ribosomal protein S21|nr:30S ribosomal protein S21 [Bdellovibrionales bacterium]